MTSDFIHSVHFSCYSPPYRREDKITIIPGEVIEHPSKLTMGIPDKDISKFIGLYETGSKTSNKSAYMLFGYICSNQEALTKINILFLGVKTRDLICAANPIIVMYKFLVLPSMKIYWLNKDVVAQILISRKLKK